MIKPNLFKSIIINAISAHQSALNGLDGLYEDIERIAILMRHCISRGGKIIWMGNGGSAADSQHLAAEIVGRFRRERRGLPSIALTTDTSILTSVGNDFGFDQIYARQVEALGKAGDLLIGISTSGNSRNVAAAIQTGRELGLITVGLLGCSGGVLKQVCEYSIVVPANDTARIQEMHILIGHILCELLETDES
ncbi:MAG: D-sedoheptulose 7-phosphate isomerase [Methylomonas sp.]|jgi:D-sedoheptulose 7-phosphate isomerase